MFERKSLGNLADKITDGSHFSPTPQEEGELIANVKDMKNGTIDYKSCAKITPAAFRVLRETGCVIEKGDVLLSKDGTVGRVVVYENNRKIGALSSIAIIRPNLDTADANYLGQYLQSSDARRQYDNAMSGSALRRLVLRDIRCLKVTSPPRFEQRRIAQILDILDTQIRQTEALIAKLELIKQGLLTDLLTRGIDQNGQLRPPPEQAPELYKDSPLGLIPREWSAVTVGELGVWKGGSTPSKSNPNFWPSHGHLWVSPKDLISDVIDSSSDKVSEAAVGSSGLTIFPEDSVLVVFRSGILRKRLPVIRVTKPFTVNQDIKALFPNDFVSLNFVHFLLQGHATKILNSSVKAGTTVESLDYRFFSSYPLGLPPLEEQRFSAEIFISMENRINQESQKFQKLQAYKLGLMDDLLTGRVRVTPLLKEKAQAVG